MDIKVCPYQGGIILGISLAITAVPVSIRLLMDLGKLNTPVGQTIVGAAIFDDVLSLIFVALLTSMLRKEGPTGPAGVIEIGGTTILFFVIIWAVARVLVPRIGHFVLKWKTLEFEFSSLLLGGLIFAILAEILGLHFIIGAFAAGLLFEKHVVGEMVFQNVEKRTRGITLGFFAPIFFASIGIHLDPSALTKIPLFLTLLILSAFLSKLVGAGLPAYLLGLSQREAMAVGAGMSARGVVELVIADIALRAGLFSYPNPPPPIISHLFSAIVIVAVITTIMAPFALKIILGNTVKEREIHQRPDNQ